MMMGSSRWFPTAILISMVLLGLAPLQDCEDECEPNCLRAGLAVNVFESFGFLWTSIRVVPVEIREEIGGDWLGNEFFRERTITALQPFRSPPIDELRGDFQLVGAFCDDISQLLQAYFRRFTIEKASRPWSAFSTGWSQGNCAANLGLDPRFLQDGYSYILVQLSRPRRTARMTDQQVRLIHKVEDEFIPGNLTSLQVLFNNLGTHYINSYTTGNAIYQVLVYRKSRYRLIKDRLQAEGVTSVSAVEFMTYVTPYHAEHTGKILSASGNRTVEAWAEEQLKFGFYFFSYPYLAQILANPALLRALDGLLGNEAVLQLELRSLEPAFSDVRRRRLFGEGLDNAMKLWEIHMNNDCRGLHEWWFDRTR